MPSIDRVECSLWRPRLHFMQKSAATWWVHPESAQRICSSVRQFLILSTFVLVLEEVQTLKCIVLCFWSMLRNEVHTVDRLIKNITANCWWRAVKTRVRLIALSVRGATICRYLLDDRTILLIGAGCCRVSADCGQHAGCPVYDNRRRRMRPLICPSAQSICRLQRRVWWWQ